MKEYACGPDLSDADDIWTLEFREWFALNGHLMRSEPCDCSMSDDGVTPVKCDAHEGEE